MIKKLNTILVVAIALSGIPVVAENGPSTTTLWNNKAVIAASVAGVLAILGGLLFYVKKSRGNKVGNATVPVRDELGQGAVERAVESAMIRTLEERQSARIKCLEEAIDKVETKLCEHLKASANDSTQVRGEIALVRKELQKSIEERALQTTVDRQQENVDAMTGAVDQLTQLLEALDTKVDTNRTVLAEELNKVQVDLDARVTVIGANQNIGSKALGELSMVQASLKELKALPTKVEKAESDISDLGKRLAQESAARGKLSLRVTREVEEQIRKAQADIQEFQPVDEPRVRFNSPLSPVAEERDGRGAGLVS